jgi:hypothetical protein
MQKTIYVSRLYLLRKDNSYKYDLLFKVGDKPEEKMVTVYNHILGKTFVIFILVKK